MLVAALLLAARLEDGADAAITTVPFLLMGVGMGAMASQLGNVVVSSAPVESGSEVGGLQYTAQNLGSSLGTALVGAIVIGSLGTLVVQGVQSAPAVSEPTRQTVTTSLDSGAQFVSDADVEAALDSAGIPPRSTTSSPRSTRARASTRSATGWSPSRSSASSRSSSPRGCPSGR